MPRSATSPRPYAIGAACVFLFVFTGLLVDAGRQKGPAADHDFRLRVLILSVMAVGCLVAAWTSWGVVSVLLRPSSHRGETGVTSIAIFTAASETFNQRNINMTIDGSFVNYAPVVARALQEGMRVRGYVSTAFGCPYEGDVPAEKVLEVCARLLDIGCYEVSVGDTIGVGTPMQVQGVIGMLLQVIPVSKLAMHFHDTRGTALANTLAALEMGIATFDASSGGLGGCPYAPGASGNMATEDLVYMLDNMAIESGVDINRLVAASQIIAPYLDHPLPGRYLQACTRAKPVAAASAAVQ